MTARPIRRNAQTPDRNGKIFYTSTTSLSHISKGIRDVFSTGARFVILILFSNDENFVPTEYDLQKVQDYAYALTTADCILLELLMIQGNRFYSLHQNQQIPDLKSDKRTQRIREEYLSDFPAETDRNTDLNYPQGGET